MNTIPFAERATYNGRRVRIVAPDAPSWSGYYGAHGNTGTIVAADRLPWVDRQQRDYDTLPVLMDETLRRSISGIEYCGVDHLALLTINMHNYERG